VGGARAGSRRPRVGRLRAGRRHQERRSALAEQKLEEPVSAEVERYSIHRADCRPRRTIEQEVDHVDGSCLVAEQPGQQRAGVIRACLFRWGRRVGSRAAAKEAHSFFGVSADPSPGDIERIIEHHPVFRIAYDGHADSRHGWGK
jgi:hypothetical protein